MDLKPTTKLAWFRFLNSPEGVAGMLYLQEQSPAISGKGEPCEIVFESGLAEGHRRTLGIIANTIAEEPKREVDLENR